jgi:FkbM family methyltransferase
MASRAIEVVHDVARSLGVDVVRFQPTTHYLARRAALLRAHGIDLIIDVGAHDGEYALQTRRLGFDGRIVSFEPLPDVALRLAERSSRDPDWEVRPVALGVETGATRINVAGNSASSSLLPMLPDHERYAPGTGIVGSLGVEVQRLDDIADEVLADSRRPFLKIDTQGYERQVLEGARVTLGRIAGIQVELSIISLYEGAPSLMEMLESVTADGFELMGLEPGFSDPVTGRMLQFDGLFFRPELTGVAV